MKGWSVNRLLKVEAVMEVPKQKGGLPLVLLIASGSAKGEIRFSIAQGHRWSEGGAWTFAGLKARGKPFLQPEHLCP